MSKIAHKLRSVAKSSSPKNTLRRLTTKRVINKFAEDLGMVYFGYIDQHDDDHRLLRGITISKTHDDYHYTVGTFKTYDIALTVRRDTLEYPDKRLTDHYWTIMTFDLHTAVDLPHLYMCHHKIREELLARYTPLQRVQMGAYAAYSPNFMSSYEVYAAPDRSLEAQRVVTPQMGEMIVQHFSDVSIEIADNTLYLYATERHPSRAMLERMINSGVWLAQMIDTKALGS